MVGFTLVLDWLEFALRWFHVVAAIAWIGSSFYFIELDLGLKPDKEGEEGVVGEAWQVHGGGFYRLRKYGIAPPQMPEALTWFKWESYATWLSGFAMLVVVYYLGADFYLINPNKVDFSYFGAITTSIISIVAGWLVYDLLCRFYRGKSELLLMAILFAVLVLSSLAFHSLFSDRAAFLHLGAITATVMTANVAFVIIPNQKKVVADLKAGRTPDPSLGMVAKRRSLHNNYLTLPVIFFMLSNHYPVAFATPYAWLAACIIFLMGALIRHHFNRQHAGQGGAYWALMVSALLFVFVVWLSDRPLVAQEEISSKSSLSVSLQASADFDRVHDIVLGRCSMCHSTAPFFDGVYRPPSGVTLESAEDILRGARRVYLQSARSYAMPPANVSGMTLDERNLLRRWYEGAQASAL